MTITVSRLANGDIQVRQSFARPTVYFDHWAIQRLCENAALRARFIAALKRKAGTLVLSHVSLAEFSTQSDPRHLLEAEQLLDELLPNLYFALFDLEAADAQERLPDVRLQPPPADVGMLKFFATHQSKLQEGAPIAAGLITPLAEYRNRIHSAFVETNKSIADKINEYKQDTAYLRRARKHRGKNSDPLTRLLQEQLLRPVFLKQGAATPNDAVDLQHAIISLAYCDFVLLDGAWADNARQAKERLSKAGLPSSGARVFSDRGGDFERFLDALEVFVPH